MWWHMPIIPELERLRQKNTNFETSLGYMEILCLKKTKQNLCVAN
jgi:hypothetical protein